MSLFLGKLLFISFTTKTLETTMTKLGSSGFVFVFGYFYFYFFLYIRIRLCLQTEQTDKVVCLMFLLND